MSVGRKFAKWIWGIARALRWVGRALIGKAVPLWVVDSGDNKYFSPSSMAVAQAVEILRRDMEAHGFTRENYKPEVRDCDNSALFCYDQLANEIFPAIYSGNDSVKAQFNVGMFSFRRDNGKRHRVAFIIDDEGEWTFLDSYDGIGGNRGIIRTLSETERAAGYVIR